MPPIITIIINNVIAILNSLFFNSNYAQPEGRMKINTSINNEQNAKKREANRTKERKSAGKSRALPNAKEEEAASCHTAQRLKLKDFASDEATNQNAS